MKKLMIMDYKGSLVETPIDLDNLKDILSLYIRIVTGDEILYVIYKNGDTKMYDSSKDRIQDFFDGEYCIYNAKKKINKLDKFKKRKSSYDF